MLEFVDVFQEPQKLPLFRPGHGHHIPLIQGVNFVNKRPYKYAKNHNDIINKLIHEYLQSEVVQESCSPYASPVVLVGKKDGS